MSEMDGVRVLVVDDDPEALAAVREVLAARSAAVATAGTGYEGIELLRTFKPDVIVSDITMPECDGYQFIRMVRARSPENGGRTPAIALTARVEMQDNSRALLFGFNVHLAKPVKPDELVTAITQLVAPRA